MAAQDSTMLVRRAVEDIWNRGALDLADILFTRDYINHAGLIPNLIRGPEAIKISVALCRTAFPAFLITIEALLTKRDAVLLRWTAHSNVPPYRRTAGPTPGTLSGVLVCRIAHNQIAESWTHWDQPGVLAQLRGTPRNRAT